MDPVESHGLTSLLHHVLGETFTRDNYLQNIPFYDPLRREGTLYDLGPLAEKFPCQTAPTFAMLSEQDVNGVTAPAQGPVVGELMDTSMLGTPPKKKIGDVKPETKKKIKLKLKK